MQNSFESFHVMKNHLCILPRSHLSSNGSSCPETAGLGFYRCCNSLLQDFLIHKWCIKSFCGLANMKSFVPLKYQPNINTQTGCVTCHLLSVHHYSWLSWHYNFKALHDQLHPWVDHFDWLLLVVLSCLQRQLLLSAGPEEAGQRRGYARRWPS